MRLRHAGTNLLGGGEARRSAGGRNQCGHPRRPPRRTGRADRRGDPRADERQPVSLRRLCRDCRSGARRLEEDVTMRAFDYLQPATVDAAIAALADRDTRCLAGGTNLLDLMKGHVEQPARLVDISRLPLKDIDASADGGMRIGALVRNGDLANHPGVRERYPLLAQAL